MDEVFCLSKLLEFVFYILLNTLTSTFIDNTINRNYLQEKRTARKPTRHRPKLIINYGIFYYCKNFL